jgi:lactoylglutathione lyase
MSLKIDHFAFLVSDMDKSIKFYQDVIGLTLESRNLDGEHGEEFCFFAMENGKLELLRKIASTPNQKINHENIKIRAYCPHLAILVKDIEEYVKILKSKGINKIEGPFEIKGQVKWMYISDPDENMLEFVQWL